jgi:hypothetical protein
MRAKMRRGSGMHDRKSAFEDQPFTSGMQSRHECTARCKVSYVGLVVATALTPPTMSGVWISTRLAAAPNGT